MIYSLLWLCCIVSIASECLVHSHPFVSVQVSVVAVGSRDKSLSVWIMPYLKRPVVVLSNLCKVRWSGRVGDSQVFISLVDHCVLDFEYDKLPLSLLSLSISLSISLSLSLSLSTDSNSACSSRWWICRGGATLSTCVRRTVRSSVSGSARRSSAPSSPSNTLWVSVVCDLIVPLLVFHVWKWKTSSSLY